jgi:hypothetical protein
VTFARLKCRTPTKFVLPEKSNSMSIKSMMRFLCLLLLIVVSVTINGARCSANPPILQAPLPVDALTAQYEQINDAILKHDLDRIMYYFTDDFTEVNSSGTLVDRDQERKEYSSELSKIKSMDIRYQIQNYVVTAAGTSCDVHFHMEGVGIKRVLFMKLQGNFTNDLIVHDLWVSTPDGFRLKSRQTLLDETKIQTE